MILTSCYWKIGEKSGFWPHRPLNKAEGVEGRLKRRLSPLGCLVIESLGQSLSLLETEKISWIASSRHGDTDRMMRLFSEGLTQELSSPTDFTLSVHNSIMGIYSIATQNKKMTSVLSGAEASFESGLLEAYALQKETEEIVGYVYYDFPLPDLYSDKVDNTSPAFCYVLILGRKGLRNRGMSLQYFPTETAPPNRTDQALSLIHFLSNQETTFDLFVPGGFLRLSQNGLS